MSFYPIINHDDKSENSDQSKITIEKPKQIVKVIDTLSNVK